MEKSMDLRSCTFLPVLFLLPEICGYCPAQRDPDSSVEYCLLDYGIRLRSNSYDTYNWETVVDYAASRGLNHLKIPSSGGIPDNFVLDYERFTRCETLKNLHLRWFDFQASFSTLTNLKLEFCRFDFCDKSRSFDILSYYPNLERLWLYSLYWCDSLFNSKVMEISSPRLVYLAIERCDEGEVDIDAPNLTYLKCNFLSLKHVSLTNLTSLQRAAIHIHSPRKNDCSLITFFRSLRNVQSLYLCRSVVEALSEVPGLEDRSTPFTRLKNWSSNQHIDEVPIEVLNYLGCDNFEYIRSYLLF